MDRLFRRLLTLFVPCVYAVLLLAGCQSGESASADATATPVLLVLGAPATAAPTQTPQPTPEPTTEPTQEPTAVYVTVGVVGDIMAMETQCEAARDAASGAYDFTRSFYGMETIFKSVDLMCANLEVPLAGAEAGYSKRAGSGATPSFNAPDALAENLQALGVDVLTIANNHCLDRGLSGMFRTIQTLDALGILNTGGYISQADRAVPCIAEVNGVKIGLIAATYGVNNRDSGLDGDEQACISYLRKDRERLAADIANCRAAGAEFILCFPHWDHELTSETSGLTRERAQWLFENGVDCIVGSHPHVVQGMEWMKYKRDGETRSGLVCYSVGNFIANMSQENVNYGLFVRLTIKKDVDGTVTLDSAGYLPTTYFGSTVGGKTLHQVIPAYASAYVDARVCNPPSNIADRIARARAHVLRVCGTGVIPVLEDTCWID